MRSRSTPAGPWILSLDVGSSSVRAVLFDVEGRSLEPVPGSRRAYRWSPEVEGAMECDAELLFTETVAAVDAALTQVREERLEVVAVAVTTFWHSLLGIGPDGAAATPVYGWGDTRAADVALRLRDEVDEDALHRRTGCFLHPSYPLVKLAWLRRADPGAFARRGSWVSYPEHLEERLFGARRCSISMASGSGLLDVHHTGWDEEALSIAGVTATQLSPLVDADEPIAGLRAEFAARWPELASIPWFPALGDGVCANAGSGAVGVERPGLTVGTSAAVRTLWEPSGAVAVPEDLWCYRLDRRRWVAGGALSNGGNAVAWLRRTLRLPEADPLEARLATMQADGHGLTVLPFLLGERGPGWRRERTASAIGITEATTPEEILQAWMEAVTYRIARVARRLEETVGEAREVLASGGALHASPAWTQIISDTLDRPVLLPIESEDTSRGAALIALESMGLRPGLRAQATSEGVRFLPRAQAHARHRAAMRRQQRLLDSEAEWTSAAPAVEDPISTP
jgi:gluconokinase